MSQKKLSAQVARVSPEKVHKGMEKMSAHLEKQSLFSGNSSAQSLSEARLFSCLFTDTLTCIGSGAP